jgi:hypothetical protein
LDDYACSEEWKCPKTPADHMAKDGDIIGKKLQLFPSAIFYGNCATKQVCSASIV